MEAEFVEWLRRRVRQYGCVAVGIGDDAAVLRWPDAGDLVMAADMLAEGVHFRTDDLGARRVGRKALAVNLSDMAAMAARPLAATVSLLLPRRGGDRLARELFEGLFPLADQFAVALVGGDTNTWDGPLVVDVAVLGRLTPAGPLLRSAAKVGDRVLVTGRLGGSILGRHADFMPRVEAAIVLRQEYGVEAGMDTSDGLALDLHRLVEASGVGAVLDVYRVPVHADAERLALQPGGVTSALTHALTDGEDFELIVTASAEVARRLTDDQPIEVPITDVGEIVAQLGLFQRDASGGIFPLAAAGYEHRVVREGA